MGLLPHQRRASIDSDHNLIVSARHTWAIYKINRHHGNDHVAGADRPDHRRKYTTGAQSNFKIGKGAAFAWQHDPEPLGNNEYRIFDNNWNQVSPPP